MQPTVFEAVFEHVLLRSKSAQLHVNTRTVKASRTRKRETWQLLLSQFFHFNWQAEHDTEAMTNLSKLKISKSCQSFVQVAKVRCATLKEWALQVDSVFIAVCI